MAGKPRKELDQTDFEALLSIQCTLDEIVAFFDVKLGGVTKRTVQAWVKRTYKRTFEDVAEEKRAYGKISIRRAQFRLMEKNPGMAIFLGKVYLGQNENQANDDTKETLKKLDQVLNGIEGSVI